MDAKLKQQLINALYAHAPYYPEVQYVYKGEIKTLILQSSTLHLAISNIDKVEFKLKLVPLTQNNLFSVYNNGDNYIDLMIARNYHDGINVLDFLKKKNSSAKTLRYSAVQLLLEYQFDVFNLIGKGYAIDINTITK